jgi:hypothetical protein
MTEYKVINTMRTDGWNSAHNIEQSLNAVAKDGWRLAEMERHCIVLKKEEIKSSLSVELRLSAEDARVGANCIFILDGRMGQTSKTKKALAALEAYADTLEGKYDKVY